MNRTDALNHVLDELRGYIVAWENWTPEAILKSHAKGMLYYGNPNGLHICHGTNRLWLNNGTIIDNKPGHILVTQSKENVYFHFSHEEVLTALNSGVQLSLF